jgi:hypothetical protein
MAPHLAGASVTTTGCAGTSFCTLAELIAGGTITVNTMVFADWELESIDLDGVSPDFNLIVVEGKDDGGLVPGNGIKFSGNGELLVVGADRLDMAIGFTVDSAMDFLGNSLTILSDTVVGTAFLKVGEFVADGSGVGLGQKEVETDPFFAPLITTDAIEFPVVQTKLIIEKDILLQSSAAGDSAELDMFEQRFVPEPNGTLALVVGAGALWWLGKLRSAGAANHHRTAST